MEYFLVHKFLEKMEFKDVTNTKTLKTDIFELVWLCGVHPTAESSPEYLGEIETEFENT